MPRQEPAACDPSSVRQPSAEGASERNLASRSARFFVAGALTLLIPAAALAAPQVRGKLIGLEKLMNPVWAEAKESSAHRFSWREPSPTVKAEFRNLSGYAPKEVCIAALASSPQPPPA